MLEAWFAAFLLTQGVECPIYRYALGPGRAAWLKAFSISAVTHPLFFLVLPLLVEPSPWQPLWLVELLVVGLEFLLLRWMGAQSVLSWVLFANGASLLVGGVTRTLWGWP